MTNESYTIRNGPPIVSSNFVQKRELRKYYSNSSTDYVHFFNHSSYHVLSIKLSNTPGLSHGRSSSPPYSLLLIHVTLNSVWDDLGLVPEFDPRYLHEVPQILREILPYDETHFRVKIPSLQNYGK